MRQSPIVKLGAKLREIRRTRKRLHRQFARRRITARDLDAVYESLFLRATVAFEAYCEQLFFEILTGRRKYSRNTVSCRLGVISMQTARLIVFQDKKYVEWLPWDKTKKRCKLYLDARGAPETPNGRPFIDLEARDTELINRIVKIRNAIAHSSDSAIEQFMKDVISVAGTPPSERTPAPFLRGIHSPGVTRLENYIESMFTVAAKIYGKPKK